MKKDFDIFENVSPSKKPELPNDYFKTLEKEIVSRSINQKEKESTMFKKTSFWIGVLSAACIGFIILLNTSKSTHTISETAQHISFEQITTKEVEEYLDQNLIDLDEDLIAEVFEIDSEFEINHSDFKEIDEEALEKYLEDYFIEENDLENS